MEQMTYEHAREILMVHNQAGCVCLTCEKAYSFIEAWESRQEEVDNLKEIIRELRETIEGINEEAKE